MEKGQSELPAQARPRSQPRGSALWGDGQRSKGPVKWGSLSHPEEGRGTQDWRGGPGLWELGLVPGTAPTSLPAPLSSTTGARATFHLPTLGQKPERRWGGEAGTPRIHGGCRAAPRVHRPTVSPAPAASPRGTQPRETPEPHGSRMSPLTAWKLQGVWPGARACRRKLWAVAVAGPLGGGVSAPGASSLQAEPQAGKARHSRHEPPLAPSLGGHRSAARCWLGAPSPCSA